MQVVVICFAGTIGGQRGLSVP